ncbi:hypothetical protein QUA85_11355 [Microcoleus sp. F8-C4]
MTEQEFAESLTTSRIQDFHATIPWTDFDRMFEQVIGKVLNLDEIIERLQATDCQNCAPFTTEQVKFAFLKWLQNNLDSIEMQPEWFINQEPKHFERYLPELDNGYFPEEDYDQGVLHEEQIAHDAAQFQLDSQLAAVNLAAKLAATDHQPSQLEDDFDGTPQQAALAALDW